MSRRAFIKWLLLLSGVVLASLAAFFNPWKLLKPKGSDLSSDETLTNPSNASEPVEPAAGGPLFAYFILSDLHVTVDEEGPSRRLKMALEDIKQLKTASRIDTIMFTGDLTDFARDNDYKVLKKILGSYKLPPLHANMGNHEYYSIWIDKNGAFNKATMPNGKSDAMSRDKFQRFFGYDKPFHDVWVNGYHLILLSQDVYVQEKPEVGEGAWYSDGQLTWFEEMVSRHKDGKPFFVMIHQPLPEIGRDGGSHRLIRAKRFREILKPYKNAFVFSGHNHQDFQNGVNHYVRETFHWFQNSSVGRVLNRNYEPTSVEKSQGLYVEVYADKVVLRGREFVKRAWLDEANWTVDLDKMQV